MRRLVILAVVASVLVSPGTASAFGYSDSGFDPDDRTFFLDPDIRKTTRTVSVVNGTAYLKVSFWAYEYLGDWWDVRVNLDTRRGPRLDFRMDLHNSEDAGSDCSWQARASSDPKRWGDGAFKQIDDKASCRVLLSKVKPTKRIRWKLISVSRHGYETEFAPNGGGWYT